MKAKPDSRPPLEHPKKGILLNGKWVKEGTSKFIPLAKGIWRLRTYVENLEFRPGNIKILKYGRGLGLIIEWMIASYKCASFVEQIIDVENERCVCCFNFVVFFFFLFIKKMCGINFFFPFFLFSFFLFLLFLWLVLLLFLFLFLFFSLFPFSHSLKLEKIVHFREMELKEEEEEMWGHEENYRSLLADVVQSEEEVASTAKRTYELERVLEMVSEMRDRQMIPATLEDDVAVELLGTGNVHFHTRVIENVEPKTLWGGGSVDEDGIMLQPGDLIDIYSPTTRQVFQHSVEKIAFGEIHVNEEM